MLQHFCLGQFSAMFLLLLCSIFAVLSTAESSIYEVLESHGLPRGLLPKGVKNFTLDNSGKFVVHLDQACNAKFENEFHYDRNVSGTISYGQIHALSGIEAQDLFLWFPVKDIRVDIPSSGLIYFNVGVVSKQFSLSSFETPRDCTVVQLMDLQDDMHIADAVSKVFSLSGLVLFYVDHFLLEFLLLILFGKIEDSNLATDVSPCNSGTWAKV